MTRTGPAQPARALGCEFEVFTTPPPGFVEIGAVDVNPGGYGVNDFRDVAAFKAKIQPYVCQAGGDAAIAYANGFGMYIKATILKRDGSLPATAAVAEALPPPLPPPSPPQAQAAPPAPAPPPAADPGGCRYDTQCKGDRLCVQGSCVDPATRAQSSAPVQPAH